MFASGLFAQSKISHNARNYLQRNHDAEMISDSVKTQLYAIRSVEGQEMISAFIHFTAGVDVSLLDAFVFFLCVGLFFFAFRCYMSGLGCPPVSVFHSSASI